MQQQTHVPRGEDRVPLRLFVKLSNPATGKFELSQTIDISRHGALVLTKTAWRHNQHLLVRSIRSSFSSYARVAHCHSRPDGSFAVGLELYQPAPDWSHPVPHL